MRRALNILFGLGLVALGLVALAAAPAAAQAIETATAVPGVGWTVTPSVLANTTWDDNPLVRGRGDLAPKDLVNVLNPRLDVDFRGRRGEFTGNYDGAFRMYRQLSDLNSYDQDASVSGRRLLTKHLSIFARNQFTVAPTTEQLELVGVPYVRTGSKNEYFSGGVDAALSKRVNLVGSYNFQIVRFQQAQFLSYRLVGGHSHGASVLVRRAITDRTSVTGSYNLQVATVGGVNDAFEIHSAEAGVERRLSDHVRMSVSGGISRLATNATTPARTGPSISASVIRQFQLGTVDVGYSRAFVPSYGFGGTQQNEELRANARLPLGRALYSQGSFAWRRNEPLVLGAKKLRTLYYEASVGYMLAPWVGIEGFFDSSAQRLDLPGGTSDHHRIGAQIVTTKPMRIR
jgi:hypothetical protein